MDKRRCFGFGMCLLLGLLSLVSTNAGCSLEEALVDGLFGGISDTVAALVSETALAVALGGTS